MTGQNKMKLLTWMRLVLVLGLYNLGGTSCHAADLLWNPAALTNGASDGSGTWSAWGTNWWDGSAVTNWTSSRPDSATFGAGGNAGTVTLGAPVGVSNIMFAAVSNGSYLIRSSTLILDSPSTITVISNATISSSLAGGRLIKMGAGTLTLSAVNSFSEGTVVNEGTLLTSTGSGTSGGALGGGSVTVNAGGTLASADSYNTFFGHGKQNNGPLIINAGGTVSSPGTFNNHLPALIMNGGVLSATNFDLTFGSWHFDFGVSTPGNGTTSTIRGGNAGLTQAGATVFSTGSNDTLIVTAALDHGTNLVKAGAGTLILTASNSFKGTTRLSNGTLIVNGYIGTGALSVASGATLRGTGVVEGGVTSSGSISPGLGSAGALTLRSTYTQEASGVLSVGVAGLVQGTSYSHLVVSNMASLNGTIAVTLATGFTPEFGDVFEVVRAGSLTGRFSNAVLPPMDARHLFWQIGYSRTSVFLAVVGEAAMAQPFVTNGFVVDIMLTGGGQGYTNVPTVRIIGGEGTGAVAVAALSNGMVTGISITNPGFGYTSTPVVVISPPFILEPQHYSMRLMSVLVYTNLALGTNYQPQVLQSGGWISNGPAFSASGSVYSQFVDGVANPSSFRLIATPVPLQAFATSSVLNGYVVNVLITNGGMGYTSPPDVFFIGAGSNASAVATVSGGEVTAVVIVNPGSGYTSGVLTQIAPPPSTWHVPMVTPHIETRLGLLSPYDLYQTERLQDLRESWNTFGGTFIPTSMVNVIRLPATNLQEHYRAHYMGMP